MNAIATIGHSNRTIVEFCSVLSRFEIKKLVDVRRYPSSAHNPQFNQGPLVASLKSVGIAYEHAPTLGGMREPSQSRTKNDGWVELAFRNYADFALSGAFQAAIRKLILTAEKEACVIMCAERDWRKCHRQIITDYMILRGFAVTHLLEENRVEQARLSPLASGQGDGTILYPARQGQLGLG